MKLPPIALREFQEAWATTMGHELSDVEAKERAERVLTLLQVLTKLHNNSPP